MRLIKTGDVTLEIFVDENNCNIEEIIKNRNNWYSWYY